MPHGTEARRAVDSYRTEATEGHELTHGCWESHPGSLEDVYRPVLLTGLQRAHLTGRGARAGHTLLTGRENNSEQKCCSWGRGRAWALKRRCSERGNKSRGVATGPGLGAEILCLSVLCYSITGSCCYVLSIVSPYLQFPPENQKKETKNYGPIADIRDHRNLLEIKFVPTQASPLSFVHGFKPVQETPNPIQVTECGSSEHLHYCNKMRKILPRRSSPVFQ